MATAWGGMSALPVSRRSSEAASQVTIHFLKRHRSWPTCRRRCSSNINPYGRFHFDVDAGLGRTGLRPLRNPEQVA